MPLGGSPKPRANWWHSVSTGRNWFSNVRTDSTNHPAKEVAVKSRAKLAPRHAKG